jgi:ATP-binding protein involved in chromosome partitioning
MGAPIATQENSMVGIAFLNLAQKVVEQVDYRNQHLAPTQKVEMKTPK